MIHIYSVLDYVLYVCRSVLIHDTHFTNKNIQKDLSFTNKNIQKMLHLIENKISIKIPHRLPIKHTPAPPSQVNAESCKKYSTIVFAKGTTTKCQNTEKRSVFDSFSQRGHQIAIAYNLRLTDNITLGSGRYFVKVTSFSLISKLQLQLFYRLSVCRIGSHLSKWSINLLFR